MHKEIDENRKYIYNSSVMLDRLPIFIDPLKFSEKGKVVAGTINISELPRLAGILIEDSGLVEVSLVFGKERRQAYVQGKINADLKLECQACLGQVNWTVDTDFNLAIVSSMEQADKIPSNYEPLMMENEKVLLMGLIEDELLLMLPDFPRHNYDCVENDHSSLSISEDGGNLQMKTDNPFSILEKLKNTGDK